VRWTVLAGYMEETRKKKCNDMMAYGGGGRDRDIAPLILKVEGSTSCPGRGKYPLNRR
jgi:hypothetical protein